MPAIWRTSTDSAVSEDGISNASRAKVTLPGSVNDMGLGSERDLVPLGAGFDIVKRGYSRNQVEEHLERLDSDLRLIAADRDAAVSQVGDLARQMEHARSQIEQLRGQVDRLSLPPTTLEGLSERLQRMLKLAQEESSDTKARAEADAVQIRARSEADGAALRNRYEKLIAEVDGRRVELETEHHELMEKANAELAAKAKAAEDERTRADEEAQARRTQIEDDFEIAMASRRTESMKALAEQEATSKSEAERRVREATDEAAHLRATVAEEQRVSKTEAERRLRESKAEAERRVREASEEASRLRTMVAEEQRASKIEAERRLRESTEEANRRRHDAVTEAQARLQDSVEEANRRVREATDEANRRITLAAGRVESLRTLRTQLADQLRAAHALMASATPALDPLPDEEDTVGPPAKTQSRPVSGQWPPTDPAPRADEPAPSPDHRAQSTTTQAIANAPTRRNPPVAPPKNGQQGQAKPAAQQGQVQGQAKPAASRVRGRFRVRPGTVRRVAGPRCSDRRRSRQRPTAQVRPSAGSRAPSVSRSLDRGYLAGTRP